MSHRRHVFTVAAWEFRRYFKWKDQLVGISVFLLIGLLWMGVARLMGVRGEPALVGLDGVSLQAPAGAALRFVPAPATAEERRAAFAGGELEGILSRHPDGRFELLVVKQPRYRGELETLLAAAVLRERLAAAGLDPAHFERMVAPPELAVRFTDPARERHGRGEKIAAGVLAALMLMTVFTCMAYLLTGITGEKQLRVTESVVSAIPPQAWIDGKILGITAYSLVSVGILVAGGLLVALAAKLASGFTLPPAAIRPAALITLVIFTVLGLLLWNAFYAALAATIDDPNTSSRSSLMLIPALPTALAVVAIRDPDGVLARALSLFPLTSAPTMPVRLVLSDPGVVEIAASALLLAGTAWAFRRLAGRIFEVGILLYGKEPTLREIVRWARQRREEVGEVPSTSPSRGES